MSEWEAELLCTKQPMSKGLCHWLHPDASTLHYLVQVRLSRLSSPCPIKPSLEIQIQHKHPQAPKSSTSDTRTELFLAPLLTAYVHHSWQAVGVVVQEHCNRNYNSIDITFEILAVFCFIFMFLNSNLHNWLNNLSGCTDWRDWKLALACCFRGLSGQKHSDIWCWNIGRCLMSYSYCFDSHF